MLLPHPAYSAGLIVLISGKPELAFGADDVEDLEMKVSQLLSSQLSRQYSPPQENRTNTDTRPRNDLVSN